MKIFEYSAGEPGAVGGLDFYRGFGPDVSVVLVRGGESVGCVGVKFGWFGVGDFGEEFAGEAKDGSSVASVGHDVDVEHWLVFDDGDFFEFKAGHCELVGDGFGVECGIDEITDHGIGEFHGLGYRLGELTKESEIVVEEMAKVVDTVRHHGNALDSESEGESAIDFGIDVVSFEDVGVDETCATEFDPFTVEQFGG